MTAARVSLAAVVALATVHTVSADFGVTGCDRLNRWGNCGVMTLKQWEAEPSSVQDLICSLSWPCSEALSIAHCESRFLEDAQNLNPYGEFAGLFQIGREWHEWRFLRRGWTWAEAYKAVPNATVAHEIWQESGWVPWQCKA